MPDLYIPISIGKFSLQNHLTSCWVFDKDHNRLISGAFNGDIIIWIETQEGDYKPSVHLSPHLLYSVGSVTCLQIVKRPFSEFQSHNKNWCLLSIHQDKRVRLWNMEDGKLFIISDHDPFINTKFIDKVQHLGEKDSRYLVCSGISNSIYIYDIWKMRCSKVYQIYESIDPPIFYTISVINKFEIGAVSSKSLVYLIDARKFQRLEKQDYMKYLEGKKYKKAKIGNIKLECGMTSTHSLQDLPKKKVMDSYYNQNSDFMVIVQSKQIIFLEEPYKYRDGQRDIIILLGQTRKFKKVYHVQMDDSIYIFQYNTGDVIFIYEKDIKQLFKILNSIGRKSINYSFGGFNFTKQQNRSVGFLCINMPQFLRLSKTHQYIYQQDILIFSRQQNSYLLNLDEQKIQIYNLQECLDPKKLSICKNSNEQDWDTQLCSDGVELSIQSQSVYISEKVNLNFLIPEREMIFETTQLSLLNELLNQESKYFSQIKELISGEKCLNQTLAVIDNLTLMLFITTESGLLYGFPFFHNKEALYQVYFCKCSQYPLTAITYYKNNLFIQDKANILYILNLQNLAINGKEGFKLFELRPNLQQSLSGMIKKRLRLRCLHIKMTCDKKGWTPIQQDINQAKQDYSKSIIVFQLEDGSLILYSTKINKITHVFHYVFDNNLINELLNIYFHPLLNKYIIVNQNFASLWIAESGVMERIVPLQSIAELFQLDVQLETFFNPHFNCNDFKEFQKTAQTTSGQFDLLEFQFRSFNNQINFRNELSSKSATHQLNYDSLGLLFKMKGQQVGFSDILNIIHYNPQSIIYKDFKSGVVIFQREQKKILKPFLLHQAYQQIQDDLDQAQGLNKCTSFHKMTKYHSNQEDTETQQRLFIIWFDPKRNLQFIRDQQNQKNSKDFQLTCSNFYSNQYLVPQAPQSVFKCNLGIQGMAEGQSRQLQVGKWRQSGLMTTQYLIYQIFHIQNIYRDAQNLVEATLSVYKSLSFSNENGNYKPSLQSLVRYCLDQDREIIDVCTQLVKCLMEDEKTNLNIQNSYLKTLQCSSRDFLQLLRNNTTSQDLNKYLPFEILCLIMQIQISLIMPNQIGQDYNLDYVLNRIIQGINQQNCIIYSNRTIIFLRLLKDGLPIFYKALKNPRNIFSVLICQLYYPLNTIAKYQIFLNEIFSQQKSKKSKNKKEQEKDQLDTLNKFQSVSPQMSKILRHLLQDLIVDLASYFLDEFMSIIEDFIFENDQFYLLPCSILDVAKKYCQTASKVNQLHILIFVELAVRTQDQNNSILKRYTKISVFNLFRKISPLYQYLSFCEGSQKLAFAVAHSVLIYDLVQGIKLTQLDKVQSEVLSISFDPQGKYLASFSLKDQNFVIFRLDSTGISAHNQETYVVNKVKLLYIVENAKDMDLFSNLKEDKVKIYWDNYSQFIYLDWKDDQRGFLIFHKT